MEQIDMMNELRDLVGGDETDATLRAYLNDAKHVILNRLYPYMNEDEYANATMPAKFERKQIQIAVYLMNKRGAEGEIQHIENGIHRNYGDSDVPASMLRDILPMVGIPR